MRTLALLLVMLLPSAAQAQDITAVRPFLEVYCVGCHNQTRKVGGIMLDVIRLDDVSKDAEVWEKTLRELRAHTMPMPSAAIRPDDKAYNDAIAAMTTALDKRPATTIAPPAARSSDIELANRLARLLWNDMPDAGLLAAARGGALGKPGSLESQIRRMLNGAKAAAFVSNFVTKALAIDGFAPRQDLDPKLRAAFRRESEMFLAEQLRGDRPLMEIWTANYTFVDEDLAKHYGIPGVRGAAFRRVTYGNDRRAGILGEGRFLAGTAILARTAPAVRGEWFLHNFLGVGSPTPPPILDPIIGAGPIRKTLDEVYAEPRCRGCHYISKLGYGLENFDQLGRWRTTDGGSPVDASGTFPDGTTFDGAASFRAGLLRYRDAFFTTFAERLFAYAMDRHDPGRQVAFFEMPIVRGILRSAAPSDYRWSALIAALVQSAAFRTPPSAPPTPARPTQPPNFAGTWAPRSGQPITITQSATELHVPRGRVWTYHLYKWGDRYEGPGGGKQVQARFDDDKLVMVAAPDARAGAVLEIWSLDAGGRELIIESVTMSEVTIQFDFKGSSISPVYARNRTGYTRVTP